MDIECIYNICEELKETSGRTKKESILKREKDNTEWKAFLKYVFDKNFVYGLQDKKIKKYLGKIEANEVVLGFDRCLFNVFEYLKMNNTGTDKDAQAVAYFIDSQDNKYQQFLIDCITKKLRLGIEKTIQKIYPELLEKFEVMRGKSYHDYKSKIKGKQFVLTEKLNGIRCITIKNGDSIIHKSRQNKVIEGLNLVTEEMKNLQDRGKDLEMVDKMLDEVVERGGEGLMLNFDLPFKTGKTNNILKYKKKYSSDCRIIGFEEGNGKYKGKLGALILDYKGYPLGYSGMSDSLRVEIWANKDKYLGVIVEIEHEQESKNEQGGLSLEYPSFERFRFDKDEVSYAHE